MRSSRLRVSLPTVLKRYVELRVRAGDFSSYSDYVRELVRRDAQVAAMLCEQGLCRDQLAGHDGPTWDELEAELSAPRPSAPASRRRAR